METFDWYFESVAEAHHLDNWHCAVRGFQITVRYMKGTDYNIRQEKEGKKTRFYQAHISFPITYSIGLDCYRDSYEEVRKDLENTVLSMIAAAEVPGRRHEVWTEFDETAFKLHRGHSWTCSKNEVIEYRTVQTELWLPFGSIERLTEDEYRVNYLNVGGVPTSEARYVYPALLHIRFRRRFAQ